jgi:hypothetical protein
MLRSLLVLVVLLAAIFAAPIAHADLQVNVRTDVVVLKDGTKIECIVLMQTSRGVLIVEADPKDKDKTRQRMIPADEVQEVIAGEADGSVAGFQTDFELTHKVIQGTGFRKEDPKKDPKDVKNPKDPKNPVATTPQPPKNPLDPADNPNAIKVIPDQVPLGPGSKFNSRELSDAYLSRFPMLKSAAQNLMGLERVPHLIEQAQKGDPLARRQVEGFLRLFLTDESQLTEKTTASTTPGVKPAKPGRTSRRAVPPAGN